MDKPQDFKTIARLVAEFQRPYHVIKAAFDAAGVVPDMQLNGIGYYSELGVEQMAERLPEQRKIEAKHK